MPKILIADDNILVSESLENILAEEYETEVVDDGLEAMASILKQKPDVLIIDFDQK